MNDLEYLKRSHAYLSALREVRPQDAELYAIERETFERLLVALRQATPLVFTTPMPGFVCIGVGRDQCHTLPDPGLAGLDDARQIFLLGVSAGKALQASDLVGDIKRPGNALRNRLAAAATWVEREAKCPQLAQAMRRPSISVADDGRITHQPSAHPPILLYDPF